MKQITLNEKAIKKINSLKKKVPHLKRLTIGIYTLYCGDDKPIITSSNPNSRIEDRGLSLLYKAVSQLVSLLQSLKEKIPQMQKSHNLVEDFYVKKERGLYKLYHGTEEIGSFDNNTIYLPEIFSLEAVSGIIDTNSAINDAIENIGSRNQDQTPQYPVKYPKICLVQYHTLGCFTGQSLTG